MGRHDLDFGARSTVRRATDPAPRSTSIRGHPATATSGTRATSCAWSCGASSTAVLAIVISLATSTSDGVTEDLGRAAARVPTSVRELALALAQVGSILVPVVVVVVLAFEQRWRRLGLVVLGGALGAGFFALLDSLLDLPGRVAGAVNDGTWVASTRFPSLLFVAGVAAAAAVGKPWLGRPWRRAVDISAHAALGVVMAIAGSAGVPELVLAIASGVAVGAARARRLRGTEPAPLTRGGRRQRSPSGGLDVDRTDARTRRGGPRSALRRGRRQRRPRVHQGLRARQPRRRPLVPQLPHVMLRQSTEDRPSFVARPRRRTSGIPVAARTEAGVTVPARRGTHEIARRFDGPRTRAISTGAGSTNWRRRRSTPRSSTRSGTKWS